MLLTFKPEFVNKILYGSKIHTIRTDRNRRFKPGMKLQLWCNNPRNIHLHPYEFATAEVDTVYDISIDFTCDCIVLSKDGISIATYTDEYSLNALANRDGFESYEDFKKFFKRDRFSGRIIYWRNIKATGKYITYGG